MYATYPTQKEQCNRAQYDGFVRFFVVCSPLVVSVESYGIITSCMKIYGNNNHWNQNSQEKLPIFEMFSLGHMANEGSTYD